MPRNVSWRSVRPAEGFYSSALPTKPALPVRTFLPTGYEPGYPYPLLVFFHGHGGSEDQILKLAPRLSRRNYIAISLRGPQSLGITVDGRSAYGWGSDGQYDDHVADYALAAIEQTQRTYHVHSERIFLAGFCEGATVAYRLALGAPERLGGVIALNGRLPRNDGSRPLFRYNSLRNFPVMIGHGIANAIAPLSDSKADFRLLYAAGADVSFRTYPTTHKIHVDMLKDIDQWIMDRVTAEIDELLID